MKERAMILLSGPSFIQDYPNMDPNKKKSGKTLSYFILNIKSQSRFLFLLQTGAFILPFNRAKEHFISLTRH